MVNATEKILRKVRKDNRQFEPKSPIATGMFLPNHSGDHSAGVVRQTPTLDDDIVNKMYVDGEISSKCWLQATNQTGLTGNKSGSFDLDSTGVYTTSSLIVKQLSDSAGLTVFGFDDRDNKRLRFFVDSNGNGQFGTDNLMIFTSGGSGQNTIHFLGNVITFGKFSSTIDSPLSQFYGNIDGVKQFFQIKIDDTDDYAHFDRQSADILGLKINMPLVPTDDLFFTGDGSGLPFAEIFVKDSVATISLDADNADVLITQFTTNGQSNNCTADAANDKITITKIGKYLITASVAGSIDVGAGTELMVSAYLNGSQQNNIHVNRKMSSQAGNGSMSLSGIIDVTSVPWDLELRANVSDTTARTVVFSDLNLTVVQIGGT